MTHDVRPARYVRSFDAAPHLLRHVMGDRARHATVRRVQGEHLERAESRKVAECAISVLYHFSYYAVLRWGEIGHLRFRQRSLSQIYMDNREVIKG